MKTLYQFESKEDIIKWLKENVEIYDIIKDYSILDIINSLPHEYDRNLFDSEGDCFGLVFRNFEDELDEFFASLDLLYEFGIKRLNECREFHK